MKKIFSLALSFVLILSMSIPAFAAEVSDGNVVCEEISFEEAVARRMEHDNISYEVAREELLSEEDRILSQLGMNNTVSRNGVARSDIIQYYNYEKTFTYSKNSNFSCAINATIITYADYGTTRYIDSVADLSTRRVSGLGDYDWVQQGVWHDISTDKRSVVLGATGHFSVTTTTSSSVEIPGFGSGSVGSNHTYLSDTMYPQATYYAP